MVFGTFWNTRTGNTASLANSVSAVGVSVVVVCRERRCGVPRTDTRDQVPVRGICCRCRVNIYCLYNRRPVGHSTPCLAVVNRSKPTPKMHPGGSETIFFRTPILFLVYLACFACLACSLASRASRSMIALQIRAKSTWPGIGLYFLLGD